jgi:hypothetical protein
LIFSNFSRARYFHVFSKCLRPIFDLIRKAEVYNLVLKELRAGDGFKRCAIVDIVPTGSYPATLKRIGLNAIGFEGFPFRTFVVDLFFVSKGLKYYAATSPPKQPSCSGAFCMG